MGSAQNRPWRRRLVAVGAACLICLIVLLLAGCVGKEGVRAIDAGRRTETTVGDQTATGGSTVIGAINVSGATWALVGLLVILAFLFWRSRRQAVKLVDMWVEQNEKRFQSMTQPHVAFTKAFYRIGARNRGAEKLLSERVKAMKRRRRREARKAGRGKKIRDEAGNVIGQWDITKVEKLEGKER